MASKIKTLTLTGTEVSVTVTGENCDIRNDSPDVIYVSCKAGIIPAADDVMSIPAGCSAKLLDCRGKLYLLGTGSVLCVGNDYKEAVFKSAAATGGSGEDTVARQAIIAHSSNGDIHLSKADITMMISNPNLLINPDFSINQRGKSIVVNEYGVDRWIGSYTISDRGITFVSAEEHATQKMESPEVYIGKTMTASVYYDDGTFDCGSIRIENTDGNQYFFQSDRIHAVFAKNTGIFLWAASPCTVIGVKLETGSCATAFSPPDPATELAKCQRYYEKITVPTNCYLTALQSDSALDKVTAYLEMSPKRNSLYTIAADLHSARATIGNNSYEITDISFNGKTERRFGIEATLSSPTAQPSSGRIDGFTLSVDAEL